VSIPNFNAAQSIYRSTASYSTAFIGATPNASIIPQDCGFFKRIGCVLGPFSWCIPAGFGGTKPFWDCVDKVSGGNCLECIGGADPRDASQKNPGDPTGTSGDYGPDYGGGSVNVGWSGNPLTVGPGDGAIPPALQRQLNRIERCACGPLRLATTLVTPPLSLAPWVGGLR
jgi:hypothetical protein